MKTKTVKETPVQLGRQSPGVKSRLNSHDNHKSTADEKKVSPPIVTWEGVMLLSPKYRAIAEKLIKQGALLVEGS